MSVATGTRDSSSTTAVTLRPGTSRPTSTVTAPSRRSVDHGRSDPVDGHDPAPLGVRDPLHEPAHHHRPDHQHHARLAGLPACPVPWAPRSSPTRRPLRRERRRQPQRAHRAGRRQRRSAGRDDAARHRRLVGPVPQHEVDHDRRPDGLHEARRPAAHPRPQQLVPAVRRLSFLDPGELRTVTVDLPMRPIVKPEFTMNNLRYEVFTTQTSCGEGGGQGAPPARLQRRRALGGRRPEPRLRPPPHRLTRPDVNRRRSRGGRAPRHP